MSQLTIIVVTYRKNFKETPNADLLLKLAQQDDIQLIIYDNASVGEKIIARNTTNIQKSDNQGLAHAYNLALDMARSNHSRWLLLLDHDTKVTLQYINDILNDTSDDVKAILPIVESEQTIVSPLKSDRYISLRHKEIPEVGRSRDNLMAINSGSVLSVKVMTDIKGFNEQFKLDFLDHWLFWRLNQEPGYYKIDPEKIKHSLSVQNPNEMNFGRYQGIMHAEKLFYTEYDQKNLNSYVKNLPKRTLKQFLVIRDRRFWRMTIKQYFDLRRRSKQ